MSDLGLGDSIASEPVRLRALQWHGLIQPLSNKERLELLAALDRSRPTQTSPVINSQLVEHNQ